VQIHSSQLLLRSGTPWRCEKVMGVVFCADVENEVRVLQWADGAPRRGVYRSGYVCAETGGTLTAAARVPSPCGEDATMTRRMVFHR
jgi:hypothetical protein